MKSYTHPAGRDEAAHLDHLCQKMKDCRLCTLHENRKQVVFGAGRCDAEVMFVGEAPGHHEDIRGLPFVGAAGRLLEELLTSIELRREDVYVTNVNKCRPLENRTPTAEEIESCKPYLYRQLEIIKPRIVCSLGSNATRTLLGKPVSISKVRGRSFRVNGCHIFPTFHPAAALHLGTRRGELREDFQKLKSLIRGDRVPLPAQEQIELF